MTKNQQLAQELKEEFAKGNTKPSQLKRSKSLNDIPAAPLLNKELQEQLAASQQINSQLEDKVLELRLKNLKDFSTYHAEKKALKNDLENSVSDGLKEIERLENKLRNLNKKKLALEQQIFSAQSEARKWELKSIDLAEKTPNQQPFDNHLLWLAIWGTLIFMLSCWLGRKEKHYD